MLFSDICTSKEATSVDGVRVFCSSRRHERTLEKKAFRGRVVVDGEMSFPISWGRSSLTIGRVCVPKLHKLLSRTTWKDLYSSNLRKMK